MAEVAENPIERKDIETDNVNIEINDNVEVKDDSIALKDKSNEDNGPITVEIDTENNSANNCESNELNNNEKQTDMNLESKSDNIINENIIEIEENKEIEIQNMENNNNNNMIKDDENDDENEIKYEYMNKKSEAEELQLYEDMHH
eukprot:350719_1